ncbi:hypothetical protein LWI29_022436 [Acer saccharum]|uniref:Uncharacterized protein n=1 Tax=Acer saccharum TaxID=4024 RepID=A0AA39S4S9_ACESA|nr:hypothetical protein LWI29_022436 [Acer saccharum]
MDVKSEECLRLCVWLRAQLEGSEFWVTGKLSDGRQEMSNQGPREKGLVGNITPVNVCLKPDKERHCNPGINVYGSVMVGLYEAVKGDLDLQVGKEVGYGLGCYGGPVLDRVAE